MFIKFVTALAWVWGSMMALFLLGLMMPPVRKGDAESIGSVLVMGVPAWAWLLARYFL